ncbi:tRNA (5-methylaminomethyl-2-thiouridine)(34)-methyltransferase MnmD [Fodinibius sp. Rm-B-1B1-1]|uniref:tRNA (5-methylaminomethyl-2-thiouridine)(34)-methyltransferase MnmD n=1 Tax=Fodinibius alkaliphilus TaxID=3140241 RepID=UPI00315A853A
MSDPSNEKPKIEETRDGSHTLYSPQFDQHYHNPNGAVAESKHVFFEQSGLLGALTNRDHITILEIGFGTGLNFLLLMDYWQELDTEVRIDYYSIEAFPIDTETAQNLNFEQHLNHPNLAKHLPKIFANLSDGMNQVSFADSINLHLFKGLFEDFNPEKIQTDYIFQDAFSPDVNPELWTGKTFKKLASLSRKNVILSTYCAASKVQGAMASAGWHVAKTQGALGKREMIVASLSEEPLSDFKRINKKRYARRYEEGDFD